MPVRQQLRPEDNPRLLSPAFLQAEVEELESKHDPFDQTDAMHQTIASKNSLKSFLSEIDDSVIADAARRPGASSELKAELDDIRQNEVALAFKKAVKGRYVASDENLALLVETLAEDALNYSNADVETLVTELDRAGYWTVQNLTIIFERLWKNGQLEDYPDGYYTPWTASDLERISRLAQAGQEADALVYALKIALDLENTHPLVIDNIVVDPTHRDLLRNITRFIWGARTPEFSAAEGDAFENYLDSYVGNRPFSLPLIDSAWRAYQAEKKSALGISHEPESQAYEAPDFDKLDDRSLEDLRLAVMREKNRGR